MPVERRNGHIAVEFLVTEPRRFDVIGDDPYAVAVVARGGDADVTLPVDDIVASPCEPCEGVRSNEPDGFDMCRCPEILACPSLTVMPEVAGPSKNQGQHAATGPSPQVSHSGNHDTHLAPIVFDAAPTHSAMPLSGSRDWSSEYMTDWKASLSTDSTTWASGPRRSHR